MTKYQWMIGRNDTDWQKRSLVIVLWFLAFACLYVYVCLSLVRFSSIYGAFHSKQTSNAGGLCVYVVSQLVARFKPREDVVRLACSSKVSQVSGIDWFPGHNDAWGICVHVVLSASSAFKAAVTLWDLLVCKVPGIRY